MYEFHGWVVLRYHTHDTNERLQDEAVERFIQYIKEVDSMNLSMVKRYNLQDSWIISGLHNHSKAYVIDAFHWIAIHLPGSYGLLYIHDDENQDENDCFTVRRLVRGQVTLEKDPFLSPYIPTVEDKFDPTRGD
ncbi:Imm7 family immunity protein [Paenibacillus tundrae]|uniref:Imm7 family immunity protein n=1 Tax=Paenibacillus tundrae TaxID=528187 RepID=UPI0030D4510A